MIAVDRRDIESGKKNRSPKAVTPGGGMRAAKNIGLLLLSVLLLTLAFAPVGQFYLAWIGLVPWLIVVHRARSTAKAFWWSWLGGFLFFTANMWWMTAISLPGMIALMADCGIYWGLAALLIRRGKLLDGDPLIAVAGTAAVWTGLEFVRGWLFTGLPWLFIGHTQSPFLPVCQIADCLGVYGITFWVVMLNALAALLILRGRNKSLLPAGAMTLAVTLFSLAYGLWRMNQATTSPGPTVLVVQNNYHQDNSNGQKGATDEEMLAYHLNATEAALSKAKAGSVNLAAWPETTVAAPLNEESRTELVDVWPCRMGELILQTLADLGNLASAHQIGLLVGGRYEGKWTLAQQPDGKTYPRAADSRNTTYLFQPDGSFGQGIGQRYDKIHLVPFGEFIPMRNTFLHTLFLKLGPDYYEEYELQDGTDNGLTVFKLKDAAGQARWRFVTPICFEDIDASLCARMFRPGEDGKKRADFIVNVTNDGWFAANENGQHFQAAIFRSIENRVPTARSVAQGISGFIDSDGRLMNCLPVRTEGTSLMQLQLDSRLSLYTRFGDVFGWLCVAAAASLVGLGLWQK